MARVSIFYDKDIKEQVFMIRGDERYARATKTVMELGSLVNQGDYGFVYEVSINVLRDVGDSSIVIYDNDDVLYVINSWQSTDTGITIELPELSWDSEHNLQAKYIGNGRCSPSFSKVIHMDSIPNPNKVDAPLKTYVFYHVPADTSTFRIGAYFDISNRSVSYNQPIKFYLDGDYVDTINISSSTGEAEITFTDVPDGLHTVKAEFEGSLLLYEKTSTIQVSVGEKLTILSAPSVLVTGDTATFQLKLTDYLNNPISNFGLTAVLNVEQGHTPTIGSGATTDSSGLATISGTVPSDVGDGTINFKHSTDTLASIQLPQFTPSALSLTAAQPRMYYLKDNVLSVNIGQQLENVPITLTEIEKLDESHIISTDTIFTDEYGIAQITVRGLGGDDRKFKAQCGAVTKTLQLEDYSQYWAINDGISTRSCSVSPPAQLQELQSGFRIYASSSGEYWFYISLVTHNGAMTNYPYVIDIYNVASIVNGKATDVYFRAGSTNYKLSGNYSNIHIERSESRTVNVWDNKGNNHTIQNQGSNPPILIVKNTTSFNRLTVREAEIIDAYD